MRRKKNAGALFMDFQISPEDRVGATPRGKRAKPAPAARAKTEEPRKPRRGERVEPTIDDYAALYAAEDAAFEEERNQRGGG